MTRTLRHLLPLLLVGFYLMACGTKTTENATTEIAADSSSASISKTAFGVTKEGIAIDKYTLRNKNGVEMSVITFGGIITSLMVPDKNGVFEDVVLGFDSLPDYE